MTRIMRGASPAAVRGQLGRFGFSGDKATTKVGKLSAASARASHCAHHPRRAAHADPRRADQPPGRRRARGAGPGAQTCTRARSCWSAMIATCGDDGGPAGAGRQWHGEGIRRVAGRLYRLRPEGRCGPGRRRVKADRAANKKASAEQRERFNAMKKTLRGIEDEMAKLTRERDALDKAMNDPASPSRVTQTVDGGVEQAPRRGGRQAGRGGVALDGSGRGDGGGVSRTSGRSRSGLAYPSKPTCSPAKAGVQFL